MNQRLMTHSTRGFHEKIREPKLVKLVIFSSFCYCHFKDDLRLQSHREKFNIDILAQFYSRSQYTCGESRKKIWDNKSMLNFSQYAHTGTHFLEFFDFFSFDFWGRNIDLGGSFLKPDIKFGQFFTQKNLGPPKFCWIFS